MKRLLAGAAALAIVPASVQAQDEPTLTADEIIVSGGLTPVAADAYGRANSVVTAEEIERRQIREVSEVLRSLPGVSVNRSGGPGGLTQVRLRGAEGNHVLVLIDGIEVSAPQGGEYDFAGLLSSDIERVEVLRGPQSALYGSNATSGVISITTKRGERNSFAAGGSLEAGSNETYQLSAFMRGGGEDFDVSFSAVGRRDGGFDVSEDPGGQDDEDRNFTLNGKANFDVTEELAVGGTFRLTDRESDFDQFNFGSATRGGLVTDRDDFLQQREIFASLHGDLETFGGRVVHGLRFAYTDVASTNFTAGVRSSDVESDRIKAAYQATIAIDAATVADADHQLTLATEWEQERFQNVDPALVFDPTQLAQQSRNLFGFAGEYRGTFFDDLDVQLGLRYDVNDDFENAFTYSVGVSYFVDATGTRFRGSVGTGVTNPSFFEQFGFIPATFQGNPDLKPEENFSWDIGVEQGIWDDRVIVDVTYFQERLKDEIATVFGPPPTFLSTPVNQTGVSRRQGVEVGVTVEPLEGLFLRGSYTWLDADEPNDLVEVRRPRHEGEVNVSYSFLGGDATVGADVRFVLGNYDSDFTNFTANDRVRLDDYFLLDLTGAYRLNETVELTARIENVTDTDYEEIDGFATRGITGFAGVKLTF